MNDEFNLNKEQDSFNTFEVLSCSEYQKEKIIEFFASKSIAITQLAVKDVKNENSQINYIAQYKYNTDNLITLERIKTEDKYDDSKKFKIKNITNNSTFETLSKEFLKQEKKKKIIKYNLDYDNMIICDYIKNYGTQGIEFINQETIKRHRSIISYIIKKIGSNLLSGKSVMNVSLPIYIFDQKSLLESFAYDFKIANTFIEKTAESTTIEKLKLITTYQLACFHLWMTGLKPFNPILGETFQTKIGNTEIYIEQTSHHPPILNFYIVNPLFKCFGHEAIEATTGANSVLAEKKGKLFIQLKDKTLYKIRKPKMQLTGTTIGKRLTNFQDHLIVEDLTNNLMSCLRFNPDDRGYLKKIFSSKQQFPDYFSGFICNISDCDFDPKINTYSIKKDNILSNIEGEWGRFVTIDNIKYWEKNTCVYEDLKVMDFTLESDSRYREDILLYKNGYEDLGQEAKVYLEEIQRNDRKLRGAKH